jgi:hypothetical protein
VGWTTLGVFFFFPRLLVIDVVISPPKKKINRAEKQGAVLLHIPSRDFFGELSFLTGGKATMSIVAEVDEAVVRFIPKDYLLSLCKVDANFAQRFYVMLCLMLVSRLRRCSASLAYGKVERVVDVELVTKLKDPVAGNIRSALLSLSLLFLLQALLTLHATCVLSLFFSLFFCRHSGERAKVLHENISRLLQWQRAGGLAHQK